MAVRRDKARDARRCSKRLTERDRAEHTEIETEIDVVREHPLRAQHRVRAQGVQRVRLAACRARWLMPYITPMGKPLIVV